MEKASVRLGEQSFKDFLVQKDLRVTSQRLAVYKAVNEFEKHFTAEELLEKAKELDNTVSRSSVYRTLPLLLENAFIREIDVGKDFKYYVLNQKQKTFQTQIVCSDCDHILEIDAPFMEWYGKAASEKVNMQMESQRLQINARCLEKQNNGTCHKKNR